MAQSSYTSYYSNQAGNGLSGFEGVRYQKGNGFFGRLISSFGKPLLGYLGKKLFNVGTNIATDVLSGEKFKTAGKKRLAETVQMIGRDVRKKVDQMGSGYTPKTMNDLKTTRKRKAKAGSKKGRSKKRKTVKKKKPKKKQRKTVKKKRKPVKKKKSKKAKKISFL